MQLAGLLLQPVQRPTRAGSTAQRRSTAQQHSAHVEVHDTFAVQVVDGLHVGGQAAAGVAMPPKQTRGKPATRGALLQQPHSAAASCRTLAISCATRLPRLCHPNRRSPEPAATTPSALCRSRPSQYSSRTTPLGPASVTPIRPTTLGCRSSCSRDASCRKARAQQSRKVSKCRVPVPAAVRCGFGQSSGCCHPAGQASARSGRLPASKARHRCLSPWLPRPRHSASPCTRARCKAGARSSTAVWYRACGSAAISQALSSRPLSTAAGLPGTSANLLQLAIWPAQNRHRLWVDHPLAKPRRQALHIDQLMAHA